MWAVHVEERREAVLSIDRSDDRVDRPEYLIFVSEFGKRRRSREPAPRDWQSLPGHELREFLKSAVALPSLTR